MLLGVSGSRSLSPAGCAQVAATVSAALGAGARVVVGCAAGADAAAIEAVLAAGCPARLAVLAAFGPGGGGAAGPVSAVASVRRAAAAGVPVLWWGGVGPTASLRVRLVRRSLALVARLEEAGGTLAVFVDGPPPQPFGSGAFPACGSGSWSTAAAAARVGVPVVVFGCVPGALPLLPGAPCGGSWSPVAAGPLVGGRRWSPAGGLFA